jgi:hypothetical protein
MGAAYELNLTCTVVDFLHGNLLPIQVNLCEHTENALAWIQVGVEEFGPRFDPEGKYWHNCRDHLQSSII